MSSNETPFPVRHTGYYSSAVLNGLRKQLRYLRKLRQIFARLNQDDSKCHLKLTQQANPKHSLLHNSKAAGCKLLT